MVNLTLFSIIIPLYNKEKYITRTINSVLNQTFKNFELIIVNDGSTDSSLQIIQQIQDPRIEIINQKNFGVSHARNTGIKHARSPYIAFLDADDEYIPNFLEIQSKLISKYKNIKFFATAYNELLPNGKVQVKCLGKKSDFIIENFIKVIAKNKFFIHISSIVVHKSVFKKIGYFGFNFLYKKKKIDSYGEDLDMWLRIAMKYKLCYSNLSGCVYYRNYSNNVTLNSTNEYDYTSYESTLLKCINIADAKDRVVYKTIKVCVNFVLYRKIYIIQRLKIFIYDSKRIIFKYQCSYNIFNVLFRSATIRYNYNL